MVILAMKMKRNVPIAVMAAVGTVALIVALRPDPPPDIDPAEVTRPPPPTGSAEGEAGRKETPPPPAAPSNPPAILKDLARALRAEDLETARRHLADLRAIVVPPPVPENRNAAILYEEAFELLSEIPNDEMATEIFEKALRGESLSDAEHQTLRDWRAAHAGVLELLVEAAGMPECRFPLDTDQHWDSIVPVAFLLRHESLRLELEGRTPEASQIVWAGLVLGNAMRAESEVVTHLLANVADAISVQALRGTLDPSAPELGEYLDALEPEQMRQSLARGLSGEAHRLLVSIMKHGADFLGQDRPREEFRWSDVATYVETMADAIELAGHPFVVSGGELELLEKGRVAAATWWVREIWPPVWEMARVYAKSESRLSMLKIAMQLERHHADHGRYPDALDADMPQDPFTGMPFVYTRQEGGFILENGAEDSADHLEWFSTRGW